MHSSSGGKDCPFTLQVWLKKENSSLSNSVTYSGSCKENIASFGGHREPVRSWLAALCLDNGYLELSGELPAPCRHMASASNSEQNTVKPLVPPFNPSEQPRGMDVLPAYLFQFLFVARSNRSWFECK